MTPTITDAQKAQFAEDGYFLLENVFPQSDLTNLDAHIEGFRTKHEEWLAANGSNDGISRAGEIQFTDHLAERDEDVKAFCLRPELVAIATQMLGPDVDLYWNQSVYKAPEGTKDFPWHQDDGYTPVTPSPYLTLWLAINDATEENGCISVLPGSHKNGLVPHERGPLGLQCYSNDNPDQGVRVPVKAGGLAVFQSLTFHKSGPNVSKGFRKAFIMQYCKAGLRHLESGEVVPDLIPVARSGQAV